MVKINNDEWHLKLVPKNHPSLYRDDGSETFATCNNSDKTIYISNELRGYTLQKVLCHELSHAIMFSYGIDLTLEQEELIADFIATYGKKIIDLANKIKLKEK